MTTTHADEIWIAERIETLKPSAPRAKAMAVKEGRILAIGEEADIRALAGPGTRLNDLGGGYLMPGLVDSHTHALWGACRDLFDVYVGYQASFAELMQAVAERTASLAAGAFVLGGPWRPDMRAQMGSRPRDVLDRVSPAHPVVLNDVTQHSLWCNSRALEIAGLTAHSPDLPGGVMERDAATGEPNGILSENACRPIKRHLERTEAQLAKAARHLVRYFNGLGVTALKDPMAFEPDLQAYKAADERGDLTLHVAAHLTKSSPLSPDEVTYEMLEEWRSAYASANLRTGYAKLFLDGVAPSHSASFIDPYLAESGYDADLHNPLATLLMSPAEMAETVAELDRRGFVTKIHAVGDFAVRTALDAIAAARQENGPSGLRHEISHCPFIHDNDLPRFRQLDVVAEVSPKIWFPNPVTAGQRAVLGDERTERCHRIASLLAAGAELTYGSDWPAAAPDANPWIGLAGMISRRDPTGTFAGNVGAEQAISLAQALPIFTLNGARSMDLERECGSLSVGKWADFVVLERPLEDLSAEEIGAVEVKETVWKGGSVFSR